MPFILQLTRHLNPVFFRKYPMKNDSRPATARCTLPSMRLPVIQGKIARRILANYRAGATRFPVGTVQFDHALLMRDIPHQWHQAEDLYVGTQGRHRHP